AASWPIRRAPQPGSSIDWERRGRASCAAGVLSPRRRGARTRAEKRAGGGGTPPGARAGARFSAGWAGMLATGAVSGAKQAASWPRREMEAADQLAQFRRGNDLSRDFSFDTISGAGPNGAIVHYRATPATNRRIQPGELYLIDSGAQYMDGTTDITRTVAIGK